MKNITKVLLLLLTLCQLMGCLTACQNGETEQQPEVVAFDLTREQLSAYTIVVPTKSNENMNTVATTLQQLIEKAIGVKLEIKTDYVAANSAAHTESEYEILIGTANRKEVREYYTDVKENDSGYALVGKKLLIVGYTQSAANSSVFQFKMNILEKAKTSDVLMTADDNKMFPASYRYGTILLNGVSINQYQIVYPKESKMGENEIAASLRDWIKYQTGYYINCESDDTDATAYEIQIGDTSRVSADMRAAKTADDEAYIGVGSNLVWLSGGNKSELYTAFNKFARMASESDKNLLIDIGASASYVVNGMKLSVMNYNVYYDLSDSKRDPDGVIVSINQKNPDVFGLNEAGKNWINKVNQALGASYACVSGEPTDGASDASYNPIFYKKDQFELVESGTKWLSDTPDVQSRYPDAKHYKIMTYVILKDKAKGVEFMYINIHLDGSNDSDAQAALQDVRKKQALVIKDFVAKYPFLPVIVAGDFNEKPTSGALTSMTAGSRLTYGAGIAASATVTGTSIGGDYVTLYNNTIDSIFVTDDCVTVQKYETWDNKINGKYPSDHLPVCAEITICY